MPRKPTILQHSLVGVPPDFPRPLTALQRHALIACAEPDRIIKTEREIGSKDLVFVAYYDRNTGRDITNQIKSFWRRKWIRWTRYADSTDARVNPRHLIFTEPGLAAFKSIAG